MTSVQKNTARFLQVTGQHDNKKTGKNNLIDQVTGNIGYTMKHGTALEVVAIIIKSFLSIGLYPLLSYKASKDEQNMLLRNAGGIVSALCQLEEKDEVTFECDSQKFSLRKSHDGSNNKVTLTNLNNNKDTEIECNIGTALQNITEELQNKDVPRDYRDQLAATITHAATEGIEHNVINTAKKINHNNNDIMKMSRILKDITAAKGDPTKLEFVNINKIMLEFTTRNSDRFLQFLKKDSDDPGKFFENDILSPGRVKRPPAPSSRKVTPININDIITSFAVKNSGSLLPFLQERETNSGVNTDTLFKDGKFVPFRANGPPSKEQADRLKAQLAKMQLQNTPEAQEKAEALSKQLAGVGALSEKQSAEIKNQLIEFAVENSNDFSIFLNESIDNPEIFFEKGILVPDRMKGNFSTVQEFFIQEMLKDPDGHKALSRVRPALQAMSHRAGDADLSPEENTFATQAGSLYRPVDSILND